MESEVGADRRAGRSRPDGACVVISPEPFTPRVEALQALEGQTVAQILLAAVQGGLLAAEDLSRTEVYVDGHRQEDRAATLDLVVRPGQVINVAVLPHGGGNGRGSKVLQTVLTIAVIALSFYVGGGAATPGLLDGALFRAAASATVATVGSLAVNAAFAPRPTLDNSSDAKSRYGLQSQANPARRGKQMPLRLGKRRYFFDLASSAYTSTVGEDIYLHAIFGLHYGPVDLDEATLKLGETLISSLEDGDVEYELALTPGPRDFTLYPMRVIQDSFTDELDGETQGYVVHTTADDTEQVSIDLAWPQGLSYTNEKGAFLAAGNVVEVTYRAVGDTDWIPATFPVENGPSGALWPGAVYVQAASKDALNITRSWDVEKGQYEVRVRRLSHQSGQAGTFVDTTIWAAMRSIEHKKPVLDETLACMAVKFKASSQINGTVPALSGVLESICPVWNGEDWSEEEPTSNPAAHLRWLLTGPASAAPMGDGEIDASCAEVFDLVDDRSWAASTEIVDDISQEDAMVRLGLAGRFSTYWNGSKLCFVGDWEKPLARQMFTGRNVKGYRYKRHFPDPVHAVRVNFLNEDEDGLSDELIVYNDGYSKETADLFESLDLGFGCTANRAYREGRVFLAKNKLQVESHEWASGLDGVACTYGDRVRVRHRSNLYGAAEGRVSFRRWSGALVAGVRLDEPVTMLEGQSYALDVRRADGVLLGLELTTVPGTSRDLVFATPLSTANAPEKGDLVAFGLVNQVTEDLEVIDLAPTPGGEVQFIARSYKAEAIMAAETGEIPPLNTTLTARQGAPQPRIRSASGRPEGVTVNFDIPPNRISPVRGFTARWRFTPEEGGTSNWQTLPPLGPAERVARTPAIDIGPRDPDDDDAALTQVDVEIVTVLESGETSNPGRALGIMIERGVPDVVNFTVAPGVRTSTEDGSSYPVATIYAQGLTAGQVTDLVVEYRPDGGPTWEAAATLPAANPRGDVTAVRGGMTYDFRARWRTQDGWVGAWAFESDVLIPPGTAVSAGVVTIGGKTPAEVVAELEDLADQARALIAQGRLLTQAALEMSLKNIAEFEERTRATMHAGELVKRIVVDETEEFEEGRHSLLRRFQLLGGVTPDGSAFQFNLTNILLGEELNFAQYQTGVTARLDDNAAAVVTEADARATAISAEASNRTSAIATLGEDLHAEVVAEQAARISAISAEAASRVALASTLGGNLATAVTDLQTWVDTSSAVAAWQNALDVEFGDFAGTIAESAEVSSNLGATYALVLDVNGHASGFKAANDGSTSSLVFVADEIGFANGATEVYPFAIVGGVVKATSFEADRVKAASIVTDSILGGAVTGVYPDSGYYGGNVGASVAVILNFSMTTVVSGSQHIFKVTVTGAPVSGDGVVGGVVTLYRDGSPIDAKDVFWPAEYQMSMGVDFSSSTASAGGHSYAVSFYSNTGTTLSVGTVDVIPTEFKK